MSREDKSIDEHLAKFPPFKGPRIGGNFQVDENVLLGEKLIREISPYQAVDTGYLQRYRSRALRWSLRTHTVTRSGDSQLRSSAAHQTTGLCLTSIRSKALRILRHNN